LLDNVAVLSTLRKLRWWRVKKCITTSEILIDLKLRNQSRDVDYSKNEEYATFSDYAVAEES
jgi:hypothetical protein